VETAKRVALIISIIGVVHPMGGGLAGTALARGQGMPRALDFSHYYEPVATAIEPNAPGYTLPLSLADITNLSSAGRVGGRGLFTKFDRVSGLLAQNGFAVLEAVDRPCDNIVEVYKLLNLLAIPVFITTDSALHLYHIQFDGILSDVEERAFIQDTTGLTAALLARNEQLYAQRTGELKEAARRNVAYLSVAQRLIDPDHRIPHLVAETVTSELAKIDRHAGFSRSEIFLYEEDYSQYVPRGHYTRSETLQRYFRAMMWYGRMAFLLKGGPGALVSEYDAKIQTLQAILLSSSLRDIRLANRTGLEVWDRLYRVTAFFAGLTDDLTPYDYLWALDQVFGEDFSLSDLASEDKSVALKAEIALLPSPRIYGGTGNVVLSGPITEDSLDELLQATKGMRLIGQRFVPDSYMFQHLVFPEVGRLQGQPHVRPFTAGDGGVGGPVRAYPRGLDLMALLGSKEALRILIDEGDTEYEGFWQVFGELRDEIRALRPSDWNANLYWAWLHTLKSLLEELPAGYPNFMRTDAWQRRQLHTALASWTQLRHDTMLYAKQSYVSGFQSTPPPGYVEPVPAFWDRLTALTRMTARGLEDLEVLSPEARERLDRLERFLQRLSGIVAVELANQSLSKEDEEFIRGLPDSLESVTVGGGHEWLVTSLVSDVHTNALEERIVEEAVGNVDLILVACPLPDGRAFLAVGPVLSQYEFKHPMNDRLNDETWRQMLGSPRRPNRPQWYQPVVREGDVVGELPRR
jgi:hypothetical protein